MQTFIITLQDESKAAEFKGKLSEMDYVRFRVVRSSRRKRSGTPDFGRLVGLWKGRKLSARSLRTSSWQRSDR